MRVVSADNPVLAVNYSRSPQTLAVNYNRSPQTAVSVVLEEAESVWTAARFRIRSHRSCLCRVRRHSPAPVCPHVLCRVRRRSLFPACLRVLCCGLHRVPCLARCRSPGAHDSSCRRRNCRIHRNCRRSRIKVRESRYNCSCFQLLSFIDYVVRGEV